MAVLRGIEKGVRRLILGAIETSPMWPLDRQLGDQLGSSPCILLIRVDRIGDAILSTPLLRILRDRFPDGSIDILLGEKNQVVAPLLQDVDRCPVLRKSHIVQTIHDLRQRRYDVVLNLHLNRSASASLVARLAGGRIVLQNSSSDPFEATGRETGVGALHMVSMTSKLLAPLGILPIDDSAARQHLLRLEIPAASVERAHAIRKQVLGGWGRMRVEGGQRSGGVSWLSAWLR